MSETTHSADRWQPGDRVVVVLPDRDRHGRGGQLARTEVRGTVRDVDPPGSRPGVTVDLDHEISGATYCYATHSELRRLEADRK